MSRYILPVGGACPCKRCQASLGPWLAPLPVQAPPWRRLLRELLKGQR